MFRKNKLKIVLSGATPIDLVNSFTRRGLMDLAEQTHAMSYWVLHNSKSMRKIDIAKVILKECE